MSRLFVLINKIVAVIGSVFQSPILLILRVFFGVTFLLSGIGKLGNINHVVEYFTSLNIPDPNAAAWLTAVCETLCGFLITIGFLSRLAAIPLIIIMSVAYGTVHPEIFAKLKDDPNLFVNQGEFIFLLASLVIFAFGPGIFSVDALLNRRGKKPANAPEEPK